MINKIIGFFNTTKSGLTDLRVLAPRPQDDEYRLVRNYVLLFLFAMVMLWTVLCGISHYAPDMDNIEELVWSSSFEWGYYKHPPIPAWFLYPLTLLFGKSLWIAFFAAQFVTAIALWFVWKLGCEFTTPRRSMIAMLMVSLTAYFSIRANVYNHNTVQTWSIVASTWFFYRALRYQGRADWLWLGGICGIALITKYSALIQFAAFFSFFVWQGYWKDSRSWKGLGLAFVCLLIVISPHLIWLINNHFGPFYYADESIVNGAGTDAFNAWKDVPSFLLTQLARIAPMLVAWIALYVWIKRSKDNHGQNDKANRSYAREMTQWDRSFLLIVGFAPVVLTSIASIIVQTRMGSSWASTFFVLFGFYTLWWLRGDERAQWRKVTMVVVIIQILMAVGYALGRGPLAYYTGRSTDSTYPGKVISQQMQAIWHQHVPTTDLKLIAADDWLGGNIAIHMRPSPEVVDYGDLKLSPWIKAANPLRCGALVALSDAVHSSGQTKAIMSFYNQTIYRGEFELRWSSPKSELIKITWGIIPPQADCSADFQANKP